jgi:phospholipid transport system substrate-binding protein
MRTHRLLCSAILALLLVALPAAAGAPGAETPVACVERLHEALTKVMKEADTLGFDGRESILEPVVSEAYDTAFMARKSVGRHWGKLSETEQHEFVGRFGGLTVATYAGRFNGWSGEAFETLGQEDGVHDTVLVKTKLIRPDDEDVSLDYRLRKTDGGWRIIDVYANGTISELALRRSEYSALLRREGFPSLIEALDKKIGEFRES